MFEPSVRLLVPLITEPLPLTRLRAPPPIELAKPVHRFWAPLTMLHDEESLQAGSYGGRNMHFGVREHAMGSVMNGMSVHGGIRPYVATFLPELPAVLLTYDFSDMAEESAVRAITGEIAIGGTLPIALPGLFPLGHGLQRPAIADQHALTS